MLCAGVCSNVCSVIGTPLSITNTLYSVKFQLSDCLLLLCHGNPGLLLDLHPLHPSQKQGVKGQRLRGGECATPWFVAAHTEAERRLQPRTPTVTSNGTK